MEITLTWPECEQAAFAGIKRRLLGLHDHRPGAYGFKEEDTWGGDIESCAAELAVARTTGLYWTPWARTPSEVSADVGTNVQVRRRSVKGWDLIVHPRDLNDHLYVLVYGQIPTFTLVGWMYGYLAKDEGYWGDPYGTGRPAFWIPITDLHPMGTLTEAVAA